MASSRDDVRIESRDFACEGLRVRALHGTERISRLFSFDVTLQTLDPAALGVKELLGRHATLTFTEQGTELRRIHGMIARATDLLETESGYGLYRIQLVPRAYRLTLVHTQDVYVGMSVPEIITRKLGLARLDHDLSFKLHLGAEKRYPKREYVIQYQETDLAFVSRLAEHVGMSFHFHHDERTDKLVFTDYNEAFPRLPEPLRFERRGDRMGVQEITASGEVIPAFYAVSDYNYEKPLMDLSAGTEVPSGFGGGIIEYGANVKDPEESAVIAAVRAEEHVARSLVFHGKAGMCPLGAGTRFRLTGHPLMPDCELLVTEIDHEVKPLTVGTGDEGGGTVTTTFRAIPVESTYRPARITPRPRIHGVMHGIVEADPTSDGIRPWIDNHGRYIVRILFDTAEPGERVRDSLPIRMAQFHSGNNIGVHFPLRPQTEVLLAFTGGDPDRPVIVGSVPNAVTPTPVVDRIATYHRIRTTSGVLIEIDDGR
jgi:type VI secretion system secreted protein VgrG